MEPLRVRVVFEDRHVLSKSQRRQGLRRCWVLLRPEMDTVAALASHIIRSFDLQETCPRGLLLSMDQFVLPPFESTEIFKDKDVIGVRKRGATLTEAIMFSQDANHIKDSKIIDKQALLLCDDVVAGEEFVKESGGYESEDEENVGDQATEMVCHETPLNGKTGSKRKRDSSRPSSSKSKKTKKTRPDECPTLSLKAPGNAILEEVHPEEDDVGLGISSRRNRSYDERSSSKRQDATLKDAAYTTEDKQIEGQESHQIKAAEVNASVSDKKMPSRSARRKKAKRLWLRELKGSEKKELVASDKLENNAHPEIPAHHEDQDSGSEEDFVPVVVKPGHIRFGPPGEDEQPSHGPVETLKWNGTINKKKGQRWGRDEDLSGRMNTDAFLEQPDVALVEQGNGSPDHLTEFEKLFPLTRAPKKGDMVAYKVVELSSSWCPELSSFRVGKVASFDPTSTTIVLDQVPGYPVTLRERAEEDELLPDTSLYKDDGSLEIDFPSLHDVRLFEKGKAANGELEPTDPSPAVRGRRPALASSSSHEPNPAANELAEKEPGNVWEEISLALEEKKGELSQKKGWDNLDRKRPTTGGAAWSLRALRRSALGPTVSLLRSNNDI